MNDFRRAHAERASRLLAGHGGEILAVLGRLAAGADAGGDGGGDGDGAHRDPAARPTGRAGVWRRADGPDGPSLHRDAALREHWHRWADRESWGPKRGRERLVLLGESTARGWLHDPHLSLASLLADRLPASAGGHQIVDLAQTGADLRTLTDLVTELPALDCDVVVVFAGNNWTQTAYSPDELGLLAEAVASGTPGRLAETLWRSVVLPRARDFLAHLDRVCDAHGIRRIVVVPEFNLLGWPPEAGVAPVFADDTAEWERLTGAAREAFAQEKWDALAEHAGRLQAVAQGMSPVAHWWEGWALSRLGTAGDPRPALERARDVECELLLAHSPRCPAPVQDVLARAGQSAGTTVVDLRRVLADPAAPGLPAPHYFLDYCHLSREGLRTVADALSAAVLGPGRPPGPGTAGTGEDGTAERDGVARFLSAVHHAACGRDPHGQLAQAFDATPRTLDRVRRYLDWQSREAPFWMVSSFQELSEDAVIGRFLRSALQNALRTGGFRGAIRDHRLREAMLALLREHGRGHLAAAAEETLAAETDRAGGFNLLRGSAGAVHWRELGGAQVLRPRAFLAARQPVSRFHFALRAPRELALTLTYRSPGHHPGGTVSALLNGEPLASWPASDRWRTVGLALPAAALTPGTNVLELSWPRPGPAHGLLDEASRELAGGRQPMLMRTFGEIHTATLR